jgi:hypothetical protein
VKRVIVVFILGAVFAALPLLSYSDMGRILLALGSDAHLRVARPPGVLVACVTVALTSWLIYLCWRARYERRHLAVLLVLVSFWALCGRVVAIDCFGRVRVLTGWYFGRTGTVELSGPQKDPEEYMSHTEVRPVGNIFVQINDPAQTTLIFVGPVILDNTLSLFDEAGFEVEHDQ